MNWTDISATVGPIQQHGWHAVACSADGSTILAADYSRWLYRSTDFGLTWTQLRPTGNRQELWNSVACSADGSRLMASTVGSSNPIEAGRIYLSQDGGATWAETQPNGNLNHNWQALAMSDDGLTLVAVSSVLFAVSPGRVWRSTNFGAAWAELTPTGAAVNRTWMSASCTADGTGILVSDWGLNLGGLYLSTDSGASWANLMPALGLGTAYAVRSAASRSLARISVQTSAILGLTYLYVSTNTGVAWADRTPGLATRRSAWSADGAVLVAEGGAPPTALYVSANAGVAWASPWPSGAVGGLDFWGLALSSAGTRIVVVAGDGLLYKSADSGATFAVQATPDNIDPNRGGVASSYDGTKLLSTVGGLGFPPDLTLCKLFRSADSGATWAEVRPTGITDHDWFLTAVSGDGTHMAVSNATGGQRLYRSADSGASWAETQPAGNVDRNWISVSFSQNGSRGLAAAFGTRLWRTVDGGATWIEATPAGALDLNWQATACDATGLRMVAAISGGRVYLSIDGGATWAETQPDGANDYFWSEAAMSSNGNRILLGIDGGRLWLSVDGGATWTETQPLGPVDGDWSHVAMTPDGVGMAAVDYNIPGSRIWVSEDSGASWTAAAPPDADPYLYGGSLIKVWSAACAGNGSVRLLVSSSIGRLYLGVGGAPAPPAAVVAPPSRHMGKTVVRCGNVWDWCLANDKRLWATVSWDYYGCRPPRCWRDVDNPLHSIPEQGREFHKYGAIGVPAAPSVDTQIFEFRVPLGYDGIVYGVLCKYVGWGFTNGSGDLIWRFRLNRHWIKSLHAIPTELGDFTAYAQLDEFVRVYSGQTVRAFGWLSPASGIVPAPDKRMIAAVQGWYYPMGLLR